MVATSSRQTPLLVKTPNQPPQPYPSYSKGLLFSVHHACLLSEPTLPQKRFLHMVSPASWLFIYSFVPIYPHHAKLQTIHAYCVVGWFFADVINNCFGWVCHWLITGQWLKQKALESQSTFQLIIIMYSFLTRGFLWACNRNHHRTLEETHPLPLSSGTVRWIGQSFCNSCRS